MNDVLIYAPLTKIETTSDGGREVSGFATLEKADKSGEIADYDSTLKAFQVWSDEISKASGGKSLGNLREMHQPKAVGKVVDWFPSEKVEKADDGSDLTVKGIYVTVRVPPSQADTIEKLDEGILTGYSIGGKYVKKWIDSTLGKMRYTPRLSELSLVDNANVPGTSYDLVKGDLIVMDEPLKKFTPPGSFEDIRNKISDALEAKLKAPGQNYWNGSLCGTYPDKVIIRDWNTEKYYELSWSDDDNDGDIDLGTPVELEISMVPKEVQKFVEDELVRRNKEPEVKDLTKADGVTEPEVGKEKPEENTLLKALLEAKQSGALSKILEELKKMDAPVEPPVAPVEDSLAKSEPPATEPNPIPPSTDDLTKLSGTDDLAKYNVAVSGARMAHMEHARRHIQAAMTGGTYGPEDHVAVEGAAISDNSGAESEVVAKLIGSSLQQMAGFSFEENLTKFDLAKAAEIAKLGTSIGEALDLLKGYDARLKTIETQPASMQPPMLNGLSPMFKFQGQGQPGEEPDAAQSRQYLEDLAKNDAIPLSMRQKIGLDLAKMDSPFSSR